VVLAVKTRRISPAAKNRLPSAATGPGPNRRTNGPAPMANAGTIAGPGAIARPVFNAE
jgi:hypothetical protein